MKCYRISTLMLLSALVLGMSTRGNAQATRTWVSGVGDDVNPCSRTAPCKTFAGAISKTAAKGEINCIDSGGFGAVTITKAITIDGAGAHGSILSALTNGIVINAGAADNVIIRNLSINGGGTGIDGIRYLAGQQVQLKNVIILGCTGDGIEINKTSAGQLLADDLSIVGGATGIKSVTTVGNIFLNLRNTRISSSAIGIQADNGTRLAALNCDLSMTGTGLNIASPLIFAKAQLDSCFITNCTTGIQAGPGAPQVKLVDCTIANNATGLSSTGGSFVSAGNNRVTGNTNDGVTPTLFTLK